MRWGRVRDGIQLLLRYPDQSPLQMTSVIFEVPFFSHERQEPVQNYRREKLSN